MRVGMRERRFLSGTLWYWMLVDEVLFGRGVGLASAYVLAGALSWTLSLHRCTSGMHPAA